MTIRTHHAEPCWEIVDAQTLDHFSWEEEGWPHYRTRLEAAETLADLIAERRRDMHGPYGDDLEPLLGVTRQSFAKPCAALVCNGCDDMWDITDCGATHLDPSCPTEWLTETDWMEIGSRHYCPNCWPPYCDECDERHLDSESCPDEPRPTTVPVSADQGVIPW